MEQHFDAIIPAPFGAIGIRAQDDFLTGVSLVPEALPEKRSAQPFVQQVAEQIRAYLHDPH